MIYFLSSYGLTIFVFLFFTVIFGIYVYKNRKYKPKKNIDTSKAMKEIYNSISPEIKESGFAYDETQNIFYSRRDAWQRQLGYCKLYDETALALSMRIHCEPVRFTYDGYNWLIELWKGQYGLSTGGEIGIYISSQEDETNIITGTVYKSVNDQDQMHISYCLKKNDKVVCKRRAVHWWLTSFVVGEFSQPDELLMEVTITLFDYGMTRKFVKALLDLGYSQQEIKVEGNEVSFVFDKPRSKQPKNQKSIFSKLNQFKNKLMCKEYQKLIISLAQSQDIAAEIKNTPKIYKQLLDIGKTKKLLSTFNFINSGRR